MRARLGHWIACGPLGHLAAGAVDFATLLAAWKFGQLRERRAARRAR